MLFSVTGYCPIKNMKKCILIICLSFSCVVQANKAPQAENFYIGLAKGLVRYTESESESDTDYKVKAKKTDSALRAYLGYQINTLIGFELGHIDYGAIEYKINNITITEVKGRSTDIGINLGYSYSNGLRPFAIFGLSRVTLDNSPYLSLYSTYGLNFSPKALKNIAFRLAYSSNSFIHKNNYYEDSQLANFATLHLGIAAKF